MRYVITLGSLWFTTACGCSSLGSQIEVIVADSTGAPIAGAAVSPVTPSISGSPTMTDQTGRASMPRKMIESVKGFSVHALGFDPKQVDIPDGASITIVLSRTAEETFKKIERTIEDAKTLRIKFRDESGNPPHQERRGALLLSGERAWYSDNSSGVGEHWCLSDGRLIQRTRTHVYDEGIHEPFRGPYERGQAPEKLEKNVKLIVSRCGFTMDLVWIAIDPGTDLDLYKDLRVSDFRHGDREGLENTLIYNMELGKGGNPSLVKIWYDPKTFHLSKRTRTGQLSTGRQVTTIETYDDFVLNGQVDEKKFKLREE